MLVSRPAMILSAALSSVLGHELFCPNEHDFHGGGYVFTTDPTTGTSGWTMTGPGGVHGNQTFNLLDGGWVEFEIDTTHAQLGVNNNFYTSSPSPSVFPKYCDKPGANGGHKCMEMDIIENNGNCMSQVSWHTSPDEDGYNGSAQVYASGVRMVRAEFSKGGHMTVWFNGKKMERYENFFFRGEKRGIATTWSEEWESGDVKAFPNPSERQKKHVADQMKENGVMFQSTQWKGWVPGMGPQYGGYESWGWEAGNQECWSEAAGSPDVDASVFSIRKLRVFGTVVQGPKPNECPSSSTSGSPVWRSPDPDMVGTRSKWLGPTSSWKRELLTSELQAAADLQPAVDEVVVPEGRAGSIGNNLLLARGGRAFKEEAPNKNQAPKSEFLRFTRPGYVDPPSSLDQIRKVKVFAEHSLFSEQDLKLRATREDFL